MYTHIFNIIYKYIPDAELSEDVDLPLILLSKLRNSLESHSSPLYLLKHILNLLQTLSS